MSTEENSRPGTALARPDHLPAPPDPAATGDGFIPREIVKQIAMDIGKAVSHHIETMYPRAVEATSQSMLRSVRNCTFNEIMAALDVTDVSEIEARLRDRRQHRRSIKRAFTEARSHSAPD